MSSSPSSNHPLIRFKESFFKRIFENFRGIVLFAAGSGLLLLGSYHLYHHFIVLRNKLLYESHLLHKKIVAAQKKYKKIIFLDVIKKQIVEDPSGIPFEVILIEKLGQKPEFKDNLNKADPFLPPFEDGQFICELTPTHNLLFNKFSLVRSHVLITTKLAEPQESLLNFLDFIAAVKVMKALDGFMFFNSGVHSGFSVPHKHLQVIPLRSGSYGVFDAIREKLKEGDLISTGEEGGYLLKEFRFTHHIRVYEHQLNEDNIEKIAEILLKNYLKAMSIIENEDSEKSYNLIVTEEWMMIVLRGKDKALDGTLGMNSMAFSGSFLVKDQKEFDLIVKSQHPIRILEEIAIK